VLHLDYHKPGLLIVHDNTPLHTSSNGTRKFALADGSVQALNRERAWAGDAAMKKERDGRRSMSHR
jgi:hypothetical protein